MPYPLATAAAQVEDPVVSVVLAKAFQQAPPAPMRGAGAEQAPPALAVVALQAHLLGPVAVRVKHATFIVFLGIW